MSFDTSRSSLAYGVQTDATTQQTALTALRFTGESIVYNIANTESQEIRDDRQTTDLIQTEATVSGEVNFELSDVEYDAFFEGALQGAFATNVLENGATPKYFTLEKKVSDGTNDVFFVYNGCEVSSLTLNVAVGEVVNGSFGFLGREAAASATTSIDTVGGYTASQTGDVMNAVNDVTNLQVKIGGTYQTYDDGIQSISFTVDNNMREQRQVGSLGLAGIASGTISVTGTVTAYFSNGDGKSVYDEFVAGTASALKFDITDDTPSGYRFEFDKVKWQEANVLSGSINEDVLMELTFTAFRDTVSGKTVRITQI